MLRIKNPNLNKVTKKKEKEKKEQLTPTFTKVKLSIKNADKKLQVEIAKLSMETELQDKHHAKRKMKIAIRKF